MSSNDKQKKIPLWKQLRLDYYNIVLHFYLLYIFRHCGFTKYQFKQSNSTSNDKEYELIIHCRYFNLGKELYKPKFKQEISQLEKHLCEKFLSSTTGNTQNSRIKISFCKVNNPLLSQNSVKTIDFNNIESFFSRGCDLNENEREKLMDYLILCGQMDVIFIKIIHTMIDNQCLKWTDSLYTEMYDKYGFRSRCYKERQHSQVFTRLSMWDYDDSDDSDDSDNSDDNNDKDNNGEGKDSTDNINIEMDRPMIYYSFVHKKEISLNQVYLKLRYFYQSGINYIIDFRNTLFDESHFISSQEKIERMIYNLSKNMKYICLIKPETYLFLKKYINIMMKKKKKKKKNIEVSKHFKFNNLTIPTLNIDDPLQGYDNKNTYIYTEYPTALNQHCAEYEYETNKKLRKNGMIQGMKAITGVKQQRKYSKMLNNSNLLSNLVNAIKMHFYFQYNNSNNNGKNDKQHVKKLKIGIIDFDVEESNETKMTPYEMQYRSLGHKSDSDDIKITQNEFEANINNSKPRGNFLTCSTQTYYCAGCCDHNKLCLACKSESLSQYEYLSETNRVSMCNILKTLVNKKLTDGLPINCTKLDFDFEQIKIQTKNQSLNMAKMKSIYDYIKYIGGLSNLHYSMKNFDFNTEFGKLSLHKQFVHFFLYRCRINTKYGGLEYSHNYNIDKNYFYQRREGSLMRERQSRMTKQSRRHRERKMKQKTALVKKFHMRMQNENKHDKEQQTCKDDEEQQKQKQQKQQKNKNQKKHNIVRRGYDSDDSNSSDSNGGSSSNSSDDKFSFNDHFDGNSVCRIYYQSDNDCGSLRDVHAYGTTESTGSVIADKEDIKTVEVGEGDSGKDLIGTNPTLNQKIFGTNVSYTNRRLGIVLFENELIHGSFKDIDSTHLNETLKKTETSSEKKCEAVWFSWHRELSPMPMKFIDMIDSDDESKEIEANFDNTEISKTMAFIDIFNSMIGFTNDNVSNTMFEQMIISKINKCIKNVINDLMMYQDIDTNNRTKSDHDFKLKLKTFNFLEKKISSLETDETDCDCDYNIILNAECGAWIHLLHKQLCQSFPSFDDTEKQRRINFSPHLKIGECNGLKDCERLIRKCNNEWKKNGMFIQSKCAYLCIIEKKLQAKFNPSQIKYRFPLSLV